MGTGWAARSRARAARARGATRAPRAAPPSPTSPGIDDAKEELTEVVDFLKNPDRYRRLGGMVPKGVLLNGPPGTGKTLLARAVAGEANVPFFSVSAAEFIEMIVGVGASRVRDLFEQAKREAPAIIFIDELDAIGRSRGVGSIPGGGHDEREQTLNQILTEMDGFTGSEGVIVLAATNRPEILDSALLRPGRFDRRVVVNPPDQRGRRQILEVHTRSVPLGKDVDLNAIASTTPGMVGADLRNLVNEAALLAARRNKTSVGRAEFSDALEKILLGAERRILISPEERERTAYHESGHALLGMLEPGADPVRKVSIIPRGRALGVTFQAPGKRPLRLQRELPARTPYRNARRPRRRAGRARRDDDRRRVRPRAGDAPRPRDGRALGVLEEGRDGLGAAGTRRRVDVLPGHGARLGAHAGARGRGGPADRRRMLRARDPHAARHRPQLDSLAHALLEHETLDEMDAYAAAGIPRKRRQEEPEPQVAAGVAVATPPERGGRPEVAAQGVQHALRRPAASTAHTRLSKVRARPMAQTTGPAGAQPAYHLLLAPDELPVLRTALELLIDDSRDRADPLARSRRPRAHPRFPAAAAGADRRRGESTRTGPHRSRLRRVR